MLTNVDISGVVLETPRLILRSWRREDLEDFYEYARVDGVGQTAGWKPHESIEKSREILSHFIEGRHTFALEWKENHKTIGSVGLEQRPVDRFPALRGREIGYVLSKDYWGRGIMAEAVREVIHFCFEELDFDYLTCGHFDTNSQSRRVIEKCGFHFLEETDFTDRMGLHHRCLLYVLYNPNRREKTDV